MSKAMKHFQPDQTLIDAAQEVLARQVVWEAVKQITDEYESEILLNDIVLLDSLDNPGERITHPDQVYLCDDSVLFHQYDMLCRAQRNRLGLKVANPEFHPALAADHALRKAQTTLLSQMSGLLGIGDLSGLIGRQRQRALELALELLVPYINKQVSEARMQTLACEAGLDSPALRDKVKQLTL